MKVWSSYLPSGKTAKNITPFEGLYYGIIPWLGIVNLFQTFDDLESVKDKEADVQAVRQVIDEDVSAEAESC
jgi:hypothetical protein